MAVQLSRPYGGDMDEETLDPDLSEDKFWSKEHVFRTLKVPTDTLVRLAKKGRIFVSESGKVSDFSYQHLCVLLPLMLRCHEFASVAKKQLGAKTYSLVVTTGKLEVVTCLEMEVVTRKQLEGAIAWKDLLSSKKVARIFSVNKATVPRWIAAARLDGIKIKGDWFVTLASVRKLALELNSGAVRQKARIKSRGQRIIEAEVEEKRRLRRNTMLRIRRILGKDKVLEKDIAFAMYHNEDCSGNQLQEHVKEDYKGNIAEALRQCRLEGEKQDNVWHISFYHMIWAISLIRNWTSLGNVKQNQVSYSTFVAYTKEGHFGEVRLNLSGLPSIRNEMAERANEICQRVKQEKLEEKSRIMAAMRQRQSTALHDTG